MRDLVMLAAILSALAPIPAPGQSTPSTTVPGRSPSDEARTLIETAALRALKQNWAGAEEAARAAAVLDRTLPAGWHELARALAKLDRPSEAIAAWEEALLRDPQHLAALEGLGRLYAATGDRAKAEALLERLRPLDDARAATLHHAIELAERPRAAPNR